LEASGPLDVGIVANKQKIVRNGKGEMQIGGVMYSDSADKATRCILNYSERRLRFSGGGVIHCHCSVQKYSGEHASQRRLSIPSIVGCYTR
jgi:hypothetical protein